MKRMTVANLKNNFSSVLKDLRNGEEIMIAYGKSHQKIGVIVPYQKYHPTKRKIGILGNSASFKLKKDFKISDEELISL